MHLNVADFPIVGVPAVHDPELRVYLDGEDVTAAVVEANDRARYVVVYQHRSDGRLLMFAGRPVQEQRRGAVVIAWQGWTPCTECDHWHRHQEGTPGEWCDRCGQPHPYVGAHRPAEEAA